MRQLFTPTLLACYYVVSCLNTPTAQALIPSSINSNSARSPFHINPNGSVSRSTASQVLRQRTISSTTKKTARRKDAAATSRNMMIGGIEGDVISTASDMWNSISTSSNMLLSHGHVEAYSGPFASILRSPTVWSCAVMLSIVGLLLSWEEAIKATRKSLPPALQSIIDSMLGEMGGIGFIGLFLSIFVTGGALGEVVEELSEEFLGDGEILLETFEFLHTAFFEVGIGFFTISGLIVAAVLRRIEKLEEVSLLAIDTDGDGVVTLEELADALGAESMLVDLDGDGVIDEDEITQALQTAQQTATVDELFMGDKERGAECLVLRERLLLKAPEPDNFVVETYFEQIFAHNLEEIVELSPVTWLPLIPLIAIDNSVDLSHGVISAASQNAVDTCGLYFSNPFVLGSNVVLQVVCVIWGAYNFWKMSHVKSMLLPTLLRDGGPDGPARLLPPRVEDTMLRRTFQSTPAFFWPIENSFGKPAKNEHERLFGAVGGNGPEFFRNSIKTHIWLCVAQIVFYGGQIVSRDIGALITGVSVGDLADLVPEALIYGGFVTLSIAQLALAPTTFLNYCVVTSVEQMTKDWAMEKATIADACAVDEKNSPVPSAAIPPPKSVNPNDAIEVEAKESPSSPPAEPVMAATKITQPEMTATKPTEPVMSAAANVATETKTKSTVQGLSNPAPKMEKSKWYF